MPTCMFFISSIIIYFFLPETKNKEIKTRKQSYLQAVKLIFHHIQQSKELTLVLLIDFLYNTFVLLYTPRWLRIHQVDKKEKLPLSQMNTTSSLALMNGAQIFGAFSNMFSQKNVLFICYLFYTFCMYGIVIFFDKKNVVFTCYVIAAISDGGAGTFMRILRANTYPKDVRGYILGLLRVPTSACVSIILMLLKDADVIIIFKVANVFISLVTLLTLILLLMKGKEAKKQKSINN